MPILNKISIETWSFYYKNELNNLYIYFKTIDPSFNKHFNYDIFVKFCYDFTSNHKLI